MWSRVLLFSLWSTAAAYSVGERVSMRVKTCVEGGCSWQEALMASAPTFRRRSTVTVVRSLEATMVLSFGGIELEAIRMYDKGPLSKVVVSLWHDSHDVVGIDSVASYHGTEDDRDVVIEYRWRWRADSDPNVATLAALFTTLVLCLVIAKFASDASDEDDRRRARASRRKKNSSRKQHTSKNAQSSDEEEEEEDEDDNSLMKAYSQTAPARRRPAQR